MKTVSIASQLRNSAAFSLVFTLGLILAPESAEAQSVCSISTTNPESFSCEDPANPAGVTMGTISAGSTLEEGPALIGVYDDLDISVTLANGQISTVDRPAVVLWTNTGSVNYSSDAATYTTGSYSTILVGKSVSADIGTTVVEGYLGDALHSGSSDGDNLLAAQSTIVTGDWGKGLVVWATNGNVVLDTGDILAIGHGSWGVSARTIAGDTCGVNTVNVTGDITSYRYGVYASGCGDSVVNVFAGTTVTRTATDAFMANIFNGGFGNTTTIIAGSVIAETPADHAVSVWGTSTSTTIASSGFLRGAVLGDEGNDTINLAPGAVWETAGWNTFYHGDDFVNNAGVIRVKYGSAVFDGLEHFFNSGIVDMVGGATDDTLTLLSDYAASAGASVYLDATDAGADRLIISGNISGTTSLFVNTSMLIPMPVLVVDTAGAESGAFVLGTTAATPLIDLNLTQVGDDFFLTAVPSEAATQTVQIARMSQSLWELGASEFLSRAGFQRLAKRRDRRTPLNFWASYRAINGLSPGVANYPLSGRADVQAGLEYAVNDVILIGVTAGYDHSRHDRIGVNEVRSNGRNFGAYIQYADQSGFHAGLIAKAARLSAELNAPAFDGAHGSPNSKTAGAEAETGLRMRVKGVGFDVAGALAFTQTQIASFNADGMDFKFADSSSLRGRIGVRAELGGSLGLFADATLYQEFADNRQVSLTTGTQRYSVKDDGRGTWARFEIGFGERGGGTPLLTAWGELGDFRGVGMRAALRL